MEDLYNELAKAQKAAIRIVVTGNLNAPLGKSFPMPQADIQASTKKMAKALGDLNKTRSEMEDQLQTYRNSLEKIRNNIVAFRGKLSKTKFGLDEKKPDDKKKIGAAREILDGGVEVVLDEMAKSRSNLYTIDDALEGEIK
jgi:septal ring factor EnvC (AmiA/AmiB activator)